MTHISKTSIDILFLYLEKTFCVVTMYSNYYLMTPEGMIDINTIQEVSFISAMIVLCKYMCDTKTNFRYT